MTPTLRLRIVLFEELPGTWVARALEHDIATEGRRLDLALRNTLGIIAAHVDFDRRHGRLPLSAFPPAPQRYWNAFAQGTPMPFNAADDPVDTRLEHAQILVAIARERPSFAGKEEGSRRLIDRSTAKTAEQNLQGSSTTHRH